MTSECKNTPPNPLDRQYSILQLGLEVEFATNQGRRDGVLLIREAEVLEEHSIAHERGGRT